MSGFFFKFGKWNLFREVFHVVTSKHEQGLWEPLERKKIFKALERIIRSEKRFVEYL